MTDPQTIISNSDSILNKATADQLKILSRLVLQRIMSSDATKYLSQESFDRVSKQLLSDTPDAKIDVDFRFLENRQTPSYSYYSVIAGLTINWTQSPNEINDLDGNVWCTYTHTVAPRTSSGCTSSETKKFSQIADCTSRVQALVEELESMVPEPIRVMVLDNDGRVARDNKRYYDGVCDRLVVSLRHGENRGLRVGLRRGGSARPIDRGSELLLNVKPGRYEFSIDDGSSRRPNIKKYIVVVPENPMYYGAITRIA